MRLVLLGPPGAGKGTQAGNLAAEFDIPHISTGEIFRDHAKRLTPLGYKAREFMSRGELVPDDLVVEMVMERLSREDTAAGFILDGFPRTLPQAQALDGEMVTREQRLDAVLDVMLEDDLVVRRLVGRRSCPSCGRLYHMAWSPPKLDSKCDRCGGTLVKRDDDDEETVRNRLRIYHEDTQKLEAYYETKGLLVRVAGDGPELEVTERALKELRAHTA